MQSESLIPLAYPGAIPIIHSKNICSHWHFDAIMIMKRGNWQRVPNYGHTFELDTASHWWSLRTRGNVLIKVMICIWMPHTDKGKLMNMFFCPLLEKNLPTFQTFCPVGVQIAQTVVHFAHFQVQARKKVVLGWAGGCFVHLHIPAQEGVCDGWVKNRGWWWYSGQNETLSWQNETHLGNLSVKWAKVL